MYIKERTLKSEKLDWRTLKWLQSKELKDPRNISELVESIENNGIIRGFRVWEDEDGVVWIIDGHHMEKALRIIEKKGTFTLPEKITCHFIDCANKSEAGKMILLNIANYARVTAVGLEQHIENFDLNFDALKDEISFDAFDFSDLKKELKREETAQANADAKGAKTNDADAGVLPENPITKFGDRYEIKSGGLQHVIQCGDSTDAETVTALWESRPAPVLMITDPPYGVEYDPSWRNERDGGNRKRLGKVENDNIASWATAYQHFPGNVAYIWHASLLAHIVIADIHAIGFELKGHIIWNKNQMILGRGDFHWKHEPCYYAIRRGKPHNYQGDRTQTSVWDIEGLTKANKNEDTTNLKHGTQKPLECMARPMRLNSQKFDGVFDPFIGSGTSLIAGDSLMRNVYGNDVSAGYIDMTVARFISYKVNAGDEFTILRNGKKLTAKEMQKFINKVQP